MKVETAAVHFKFNYPSLWEKEPLDLTNSRAVLLMELRTAEYDPLYFGVELSPITESQNIRAQLNRKYASSINPEYSVIKVDGYSGDYVNYSWGIADASYNSETQEVVFETQEYIWRIFLTYDSRIPQTSKSDFNRIIKTFKILSQTPSQTQQSPVQ